MATKEDGFWQTILVVGGVLLGIKALQALTAHAEPCPNCRNPLSEGVSPCPKCGMYIQWVEVPRT